MTEEGYKRYNLQFAKISKPFQEQLKVESIEALTPSINRKIATATEALARLRKEQQGTIAAHREGVEENLKAAIFEIIPFTEGDIFCRRGYEKHSFVVTAVVVQLKENYWGGSTGITGEIGSTVIKARKLQKDGNLAPKEFYFRTWEWDTLVVTGRL